MKKVFYFFVIISIVHQSFAQDDFKYPPALNSYTFDIFFNTTVADPYRWLETDNLTSKEWLHQQEKLTSSYKRKYLSHESNISMTLKNLYYANFRPLIKEGKYFFYFGYNDYFSAPCLYVQNKITASQGELLINPSDFINYSKEVVSIDKYKASANSEYLAFSLSRSGSDWREIRVVNIEKGKVLKDKIENAKYTSIAWYKNGFFYAKYEKPTQGYKLTDLVMNQRIMYHKVGTSQDEDSLIYNIPGESFLHSSFDVTSDEKYLILYTYEKENGEWKKIIYYKEMDDNGDFKKLLIYDEDKKYEILDHVKGNFIIRTNAEADKQKVIRFDIDNQTFKDLIPSYKNLIEDVIVMSDKIVVLYYLNGKYLLTIFNINGRPTSFKEFEIGELVSLIGSRNSDKEMFFYVKSFYHPPIVFNLDLVKEDFKLVSTTYIQFDHTDYETKYFTYPSKDSTLIPMYLTYKKGINVRSGQNPVLLYGYGGFGISNVPRFDPAYILFMNSGGIVAVPQIRGGGELGKSWHEGGKKLNKQNSFNDFIASAQFLIRINVTNPDKIAITGGSNGGLLVGAVMTQEPQLFKVAVPEMGLFDMIRFNNFGINYVHEEEYGSVQKEDEFKNLLSYSPIHNVKKGVSYPATLIFTADHDDRVPPLHSYKFAATLQEKGKANSPYLIYVEKEAGHYGAMGIDKRIYIEALKYAFIFKNLNVKPKFGW